MRLANFTKSALATCCLLMIFPWAAQAQNIVLNPGFETGIGPSAPPWIFTKEGGNITQDIDIAGSAHSGTKSGQFINAGGIIGSGTISQTLTTVVGQEYTLDFWMSNYDLSGQTTDPFTVVWNGSALPNLTLPNDGNYYEYTFDVTATGTATDLSFDSPTMGASGLPSQINLDDVSVMPDVSMATPEPGSLALLVTSTVAGAALIARRRRVRKLVGDQMLGEVVGVEATADPAGLGAASVQETGAA